MRKLISAAVVLAFLFTGLVATRADAAIRPSTLVVPGDNFYPESIATDPAGALYTSSITTGEIEKFPAGSSTAQRLVAPGVNIGTAGVFYDTARNVLWACAVDLTFSTPTELRAFNPVTGAFIKGYTIPNGGVCADIAIAFGKVYVTDTLNAKIFRLSTPDPFSALGGTLQTWSSDPKYAGAPAGSLQINGIAYDGVNTLYLSNYGSGQLLKVAITFNGTPSSVTVLPLKTTLSNPDGIRFHNGSLYVAENANRIDRVNPVTNAVSTVTTNVDQPTSLVFTTTGELWVSEGQVKRLQAGQPPVLPFKLRRISY